MSLIRLFLTLLFLLPGLLGADAQAGNRLTVFAPSSLSDVLTDIATAYKEETGDEVVLSFAGTPQIARQLDAGAPAGYFITADREWIDWALERKLVAADTVQEIAANTLVVAVRNEVENWADVDGLLTSDRFAMAEPETVPAGRYAQQALQKRGLWAKAQPMAVYGDNVRITIKRLAIGEVGAAIVYGTDVMAEPNVKTIFTFPADSHDPIQYWGAVTAFQEQAGKADVAVSFARFLEGETAGTVFAKAGFLPPGRSGKQER